MKNKYLKVAKISEDKMRRLIDCFAEDLSVTQAARLTRLNRNTAQRIYTLLRQKIYTLSNQETQRLTGEVEIDESYFGARRVRGKKGRESGRENSCHWLAKTRWKSIRIRRKRL